MSVFRAHKSIEQFAIEAVGLHVRKLFKHRTINYNYPALLKLAFNDAMTYNPETGKGGTVMGLKFRNHKIKSYNKPHLNVLENLLWAKYHDADYRFDTISDSDYLQAFAIIALKEATGPDLTEYLRFGREDATDESQLEGALDVPQPEDGATKFRDAFQAKGFDEREMVALWSIYMYGVYRTAYEKSYTDYYLLNNDYFKYLKNENQDNNYALDKIIKSDKALNEFAEQFATDKKEFHNAFTDAYLKLYTLGNDTKPLYLELPSFEY